MFKLTFDALQEFIIFSCKFLFKQDNVNKKCGFLIHSLKKGKTVSKGRTIVILENK